MKITIKSATGNQIVEIRKDSDGWLVAIANGTELEHLVETGGEAAIDGLEPPIGEGRPGAASWLIGDAVHAEHRIGGRRSNADVDDFWAGIRSGKTAQYHGIAPGDLGVGTKGSRIINGTSVENSVVPDHGVVGSGSGGIVGG